MAVKVVRVRKHPLDWAIQQLGMNRAEFQVETGYNKAFLLRMSQGRQSGFSIDLQTRLALLAREKGVDLDTLLVGVYGEATNLNEAHDVWVQEHRQAQTMPDPVNDSTLSPFCRLVQAVGSVARMSALLAVSDTLVSRYDRGVTYAMPYSIKRALEDMGYPHTKALADSQWKWGEKNA